MPKKTLNSQCKKPTVKYSKRTLFGTKPQRIVNTLIAETTDFTELQYALCKKRQ